MKKEVKEKIIFDESKIPAYHLKEICKIIVKFFDLVPLNSGSTRRVYHLNKNWVIKLPLNGDGILGNLVEYISYKKYPVRRAKCKLKFIKGMPCLLMEKVDDILPTSYHNLSMTTNQYSKFLKSLPAWVSNLHDGPQVGFNKDGKLVCYDYAYNDVRKIVGGREYKKMLNKSLELLYKHNSKILKFKYTISN